MSDFWAKVLWLMAQQKETTKEKGDQGEELAAKYLEKRGYNIIARKWKHERFELDLIAENATHIVFVEVKTRYSNTYGEPWEAVNKAKRKKICISADAYIRECNTSKEPRFDIVSIIKTGGVFSVEHIEEAFWPMA